MASEERYDIIVIGGGTLGLSSAYHCASRGRKTLVLEKYDFFNMRGSSAGYCRMWRVMYATLSYAELALRTSPMWDQLEKAIGKKLIDKTGLLNFGVETPHTPEGTLQEAMQVMDELKIPYTKLSAQEIMSRYPFRNLPKEYYGLYQANGGTIDVQAVLEGLEALARQHGATLKAGEGVVGISPEPSRVVVETEKATYYADKVIVCPGAYANEVLAPLEIKINLDIWEMTYAYYQVLDDSLTFPMWFQFEFPPPSGGSSLFYGFPPEPFARSGYVRLAVDWASNVWSSPEDRTFVPGESDIHLTMNYIQEHMVGVATMPVNMTTCLVPLVFDNGYVIDFAPTSVSNNENVVICTAGWAFKFTPMFGKITADLAIHGETDVDIKPFRIDRPGILGDFYGGLTP